MPDEVNLLTPDPEGERAQRLCTAMFRLLCALGTTASVTPVRIDPDDLRATRETVEGILRRASDAGAEAAVDVTPGRTIAKLALYQAALEADVVRVFYLSVGGYDYRALPYAKIPFRLQAPRNLGQEVARGGP